MSNSNLAKRAEGALRVSEIDAKKTQTSAEGQAMSVIAAARAEAQAIEIRCVTLRLCGLKYLD